MKQKTKYDKVIASYINLPSKRKICKELNIDAGNVTRGSVSEENKKRIIAEMTYSIAKFLEDFGTYIFEENDKTEEK